MPTTTTNTAADADADAMKIRIRHLQTVHDLPSQVYTTRDASLLPKTLLRYERLPRTLIGTPREELIRVAVLSRVEYERVVCYAEGPGKGERVLVGVRYRARRVL